MTETSNRWDGEPAGTRPATHRTGRVLSASRCVDFLPDVHGQSGEDLYTGPEDRFQDEQDRR